MSPGLGCDLRNIDVETVSDIVVEAEYMLVSHNFAPERANQTYFKISVILLLGLLMRIPKDECIELERWCREFGIGVSRAI